MLGLDTAPRLESEIALPDGRVLAYAEYGPADGAPVLFIPGAASGRLMNLGGQALEKLHVRLVSVDRPGLGRSTGDPAKSLHSVAGDLRTLVQHLGLSAIPTIANSQGAPFGLAAALRRVASRLILVSPVDEVARPEVRSLLPSGLGEIVDRAVADREGAYAYLAALDPSTMFTMVLGTVSAVDAPVFADEAFRAHFRRVLDDAFAPGTDGYARDTLIAMRPWGLPLDKLRVPVEVWHGQLDNGHSPDFGAALARRIPTAVHRLVPQAGGSLLWAQPEPILAAVLSAP